MEVATITMDQDEAMAALFEYRDALRGRRQRSVDEVAERIRQEDLATERMLAELAQGRAVLDLWQSMTLAGCDAEGNPKLAIARADQRFAVCSRNGSKLTFGPNGRSPSKQHVRLYVSIPESALPGCAVGMNGRWDIRAVVPQIPPQFRPDGALDGFHILWEADWHRVPKDPLLLKRTHGHQYVVLAQWDLTEVERLVLSGRLDHAR